MCILSCLHRSSAPDVIPEKNTLNVYLILFLFFFYISLQNKPNRKLARDSHSKTLTLVSGENYPLLMLTTTQQNKLSLFQDCFPHNHNIPPLQVLFITAFYIFLYSYFLVFYLYSVWTHCTVHNTIKEVLVVSNSLRELAWSFYEMSNMG